MATSHEWNPFTRRSDLLEADQLSGTLDVDCVAWTSWLIRLPHPTLVEALIVTGTLQVSAAGKTERVTSGRRLVLSQAERIFLYSGEHNARIRLFKVPLEKLSLLKIPAG